MTAAEFVQARELAPIACVQNVAHRDDDAIVDTCAAEEIAYVPFFPVGGLRPITADALLSG